jgi:hypothetical protein
LRLRGSWEVIRAMRSSGARHSALRIANCLRVSNRYRSMAMQAPRLASSSWMRSSKGAAAVL